jgi:hypothetical protein
MHYEQTANLERLVFRIAYCLVGRWLPSRLVVLQLKIVQRTSYRPKRRDQRRSVRFYLRVEGIGLAPQV